MRANAFRLPRAGFAFLTIAAISLIVCCDSSGFCQSGDQPAPHVSPDNSTLPGVTVEKRTAPPVGNPAQIRTDLTDHSVPPQNRLSADFDDYRYVNGGSRRGAERSLPLFGYDIFSFARETQDAQRRFLRRQSLAEFGAVPAARDRKLVSPAKGDTATSPDSGLTPRRPAIKKGPDTAAADQTKATPEADTSTPNLTQPKSTGFPANSDVIDEPVIDNALSSPPTPRSDPASAGYEMDRATPIGPISLLYRGIVASVPDNYTISSGDALNVRIESETLEPVFMKRTVDSRGQILIDNVGSVVVRGMTIGSAEKALEIRLRPYYKNVRVSIETGLLHTISILVTGAAYSPGTYSVLATATAFNLLNIAGGPSDDGSLRNIQVLRHGKTIATLDIYKMITGDPHWRDIPLAAGDIIMIPPRRSRVTVHGEVLRPAVFEMLPAETLREAIAYAGGIKATGLNQSVRVNTVLPGSERVIKDVDLRDNLLEHQALFDGDDVEVFSVRNRLNNRVTIEGAVDQPNDYQLVPGMRVADLVDRARGPLTEAYLPKAELHRWQADNTDMLIDIDLEKALTRDPKYNIELQKWDRIKVYTREEVAWTGRRRVVVDGAVKKPGVYDVSKNMRVSDLLRMAGGPTPDAELEKAHLFHHHDDGPDTHDYVNVAAVIKGDAGKDPEVMDSDRLILFTVEQAAFTPDHRVDIKGEVVNPGRYPRYAGMKITDLLALAGGFRPSAANQVVLAHARRVADVAGAKVVTVNFDNSGHCAAPDDAVLEDGDVLSIQGVGGFQPEVQSFIVRGAVNKPGVVFLRSKDMRLSDAIREAGGLRPEAYPDGAEFYRNPQMLATSGQRSLVQSLASLNDLLNDSETKRELARAQIELVKATGSAIQDSVGIGALAGGGAAIPNPAAGVVAGNIAGAQLVSPARKLGNGQLDPNGFVAVDLRGALTHPKGPDDIILVDGDEIRVPETPTTVIVLGAVNSPRGVLYAPGKQLEYYLDLAGGLAQDASKERIEIFHVGGGVIPARRARELKPGDYVFVPTKVLAAKIAGKSNGVDSFFKSLTSSAILFKLATGIFGL